MPAKLRHLAGVCRKKHRGQFSCGGSGQDPGDGALDTAITARDMGDRMAHLKPRAEIGAARRAKSRCILMTAAFEFYGRDDGRVVPIEDVCKAAGVARGTFYNHFDNLEQLRYNLLEEMTGEFDRAVHHVFAGLEGAAEQSAVAIRYYLHAAAKNPVWGWAMIHSSAPGHTFGETVWHNFLVTIRRGLEEGLFHISTAEIGRDILMGTVAAAMVSINHEVASKVDANQAAPWFERATDPERSRGGKPRITRPERNAHQKGLATPAENLNATQSMRRERRRS